MSAETVLALLKGAHSTGRHHWRADCPNPVHEHVRGSLSITETDDGAVLLHCFACGDTAAILSALGLTFADLFPERLRGSTPEQRRAGRAAFRRRTWAAALAVLRGEGDVVFMAASMQMRGEALSGPDHVRLRLALERIEQALEVLKS